MKNILTIGKHKVVNGDVMQGIDDLMADEKAQIIYSDPPWGEGNLKYWQTINHRMTGAEVKEVNYNAFINQIFFIAQKYGTGIILIEYGIKWRNDIINIGRKYGLIHLGIANLIYQSGSKFLPLDLHVFSKQELILPDNYLENLKNSYGMETLRKAVTPFAIKDKIILDPCCGMGYTAQIAIETGMSFRGNELNQKRLDKTISRLEKSIK